MQSVIPFFTTKKGRTNRVHLQKRFPSLTARTSEQPNIEQQFAISDILIAKRSLMAEWNRTHTIMGKGGIAQGILILNSTLRNYDK